MLRRNELPHYVLESFLLFFFFLGVLLPSIWIVLLRLITDGPTDKSSGLLPSIWMVLRINPPDYG